MNIFQVILCMIVIVLIIAIVYLLFYKSDNTVKTTSYILGKKSSIIKIYPDNTWLPETYRNDMYTDILTTVKMFTAQSLTSDKLSFSDVKVTEQDEMIIVDIDSDDADVSKYTERHPRFVKILKSGLEAINKCKEDVSLCPWIYEKVGDTEPYVYFPPLGLPLVNYDAVILLHFPPVSSLVKGSYNDNATMDRFKRLLRTFNLSENIPLIDIEPIAANWAATDFPDSKKYFDGFLKEMLKFYLVKSNKDKSRTKPLIVMGADTRKYWEDFTDSPSGEILSSGLYYFDDISMSIPWVTGNHPNVTSYNCCKDDPCEDCGESSRDIVGRETEDLTMMRWVFNTVNGNDVDGTTIDKAREWVKTQPKLVCEQSRLDYTWSTNSQCKTEEDAVKFCNKYKNNACPTTPATCYDDLDPGCNKKSK